MNQGLQINENDESFIELKSFLLQEMEEDNKLAKDHPERKKFEDLQKWSLENGAQLESIKLKFYAED